MNHKEPSTTDEIAPLCKETFIGKGLGLTVIWVLAGLLISMAGTAVGWALTTTTDIVQTKSDVQYIQEKQTRLESDIVKKLDIIIGKDK
jgi:hypothetical protein